MPRQRRSKACDWLRTSILCFLFMLFSIVAFLVIWHCWDPATGLISNNKTNMTNVNHTKLTANNDTELEPQPDNLPDTTPPSPLKRVKRRMAGGWGLQPLEEQMLKNPCNSMVNPIYSGQYLCYQLATFSSTVVLNLQEVMIGGYKASVWKDYEFYIDTSGYKADWTWVSHTTAKNWPTGSFGTHPVAQNWTKRLSFIKNYYKGQTSLILAFETTKRPLEETPQHVKHVAPNCYPLQICVYKSGEDPCTMLLLCPNLTTSKQDQSSSKRSAQQVDDWFLLTTGISGNNNNWLLMAEQAAIGREQDCVICLGPRPIMKVVPAAVTPNCTLDLMTNDNPSKNCSKWDQIHPLTSPEKTKPLFDKNVAQFNWTCIIFNGSKHQLGDIPVDLCQKNITAPHRFTPKSRADVWWWCGADKIYDRLPKNPTGTCALISLLLPISVIPSSAAEIWEMHQNFIPGTWKREKRSVSYMPWHSDDDPTYIDAVGVPRGVPDEYKLADQVAAGFENIPISSLFPVTLNKNVDRINFIHYNVQKLGNYMKQLAATSLMDFQNRIAPDMVIAEKNGVCALLNDECCTFIPNNTAPGGKLTQALDGLRNMNKRMKDQSGIDSSMRDGWLDVFVKWKSVIITSVAIFAALLTLCVGCCCIPYIRALLNRLITPAITGQALIPLPAGDIEGFEEEIIAKFEEENSPTV